MKSNYAGQPVAFLFAGQGNPVIGMGADLWDLSPATKSVWDCASDISGMDLRRLCLKGPMTRLVQTTVQQLAVTAINVTLYNLCRERFEHAQVVGACGHSVGEYTALYAAGAMNLETLFRTIHFRAQVMHDVSKRSKGAMLAVKGIDYANTLRLLTEAGIEVDISCDNSRRQQVIGGTSAALSESARVLAAAGFEAVKLGVSGAWHTRLMEEGVAMMRDFLADIAISCPQFDVLMNVTGRAENDAIRIKENLSLHLTHRVQWTASMEHLLSHDPAPVFVEVSNRPYLGAMLNDFTGFKPQMAVHCRNFISA